MSSLITFCDKMTCIVDKGKDVDVVYLDFSKASDTISHSVLLENLSAHGLDGCTVCWVKSRLDGQSWEVIVDVNPVSDKLDSLGLSIKGSFL